MSDAPGSSKAGPKHFWLARFLRATLAKLLLLAFRVRAIDMDRIPADRGVILAGNHVSYADPVLLWCKAPRHVNFMGKSELWDGAVMGWGLTHVWAFPVRRDTGDRAAISRATAHLRAGEIVGIFPEGTRTRDTGGELGAAHSGVAFIAKHAGAPIIPVGIAGTDRIMPKGARMLRFPRVTMCFGEPVCAEDFADLPKRERLEAMTATVMERVGAELERARRS